jgi:hypothetical protein
MAVMLKRICGVICILVLMTLACKALGDLGNKLQSQSDATPNTALTKVEEYVAQGLTLTSQANAPLPSDTPQVATPIPVTITPPPLVAGSSDAEISPTPPLVAKLPTPTETLDAQQTAVSGECKYQAYLDYENVPEGKELPVNHTFTKTWRLRNSGTCDWEPMFTLICSGDCTLFSLNNAILVNPNVLHPKEKVDVNVTMKVTKDKKYVGKKIKAYFMIRGGGKIFGIQPDGLTALSVVVKVTD